MKNAAVDLFLGRSILPQSGILNSAPADAAHNLLLRERWNIRQVISLIKIKEADGIDIEGEKNSEKNVLPFDWLRGPATMRTRSSAHSSIPRPALRN